MKNAFGDTIVTDELALNYHLMHPGEDSAPGDPNAAFYLDDTCHLHYILRLPWQNGNSFAFVHVTSQDMLHWTWQTTKLQPSFTGHGMFSGTGFLTKDGKPAVIYHGESSGRNQIAIAKDNQLTAWEKHILLIQKLSMVKSQTWIIGIQIYFSSTIPTTQSRGVKIRHS